MNVVSSHKVAERYLKQVLKILSVRTDYVRIRERLKVLKKLVVVVTSLLSEKFCRIRFLRINLPNVLLFLAVSLPFDDGESIWFFMLSILICQQLNRFTMLLASFSAFHSKHIHLDIGIGFLFFFFTVVAFVKQLRHDLVTSGLQS